MTEIPLIGVQRVEQVKQAVANGDYKIDPMRVAEKFLQFENALNPGK